MPHPHHTRGGSRATGGLVLALGLAAGAGPAFADCDMPAIAPVDVPAGPAGSGKQLHIVTGVVGLCDAGARSFKVDLPALDGIEAARVQLALTGFSRRYGVHQMAFAILGAQAAPAAKGVEVTFAARIDGLEHVQLGYTLYLTAKP